MFAERQLNEIYSTIEIAANGAVGGVAIPAGTGTIRTPTIFVVNSGGQTTALSQVQLGDHIECFPSPAAIAAGLLMTAFASPGSGVGVIIIGLYNPTGATITLVTAPWTFVIRRLPPTLD